MSWRKSRGTDPTPGPERPSRDSGAPGAPGEPGVVADVGEPTPVRGEDVPDAVLDELRQAFTGTAPSGSARPEDPVVDPTMDPTFDGTLDLTLDDLPLADLDDLPLADLDDLPHTHVDDDSLFTTVATGAPAEVTEVTAIAAVDPLLSGDHTEPWLIEPPDTFGIPDTSGSGGSADVRVVPRDRTGGSASTHPPAATGATASVAGPARSPSPTASPPAPAARAARATIVIGGDDSLPDAVYLDDDEIASSVRGTPEVSTNPSGTIVIGDELEASGAFDAVPVPSRSMDPRVRARRIAVKRAQGRKRLLWVAGIAGVVVAIVTVLAVFSSALFAVERVDVQGAPYTKARYGDRLQALIDEMVGEPVLLVDTKSVEEQLELLPWIERAFVTTDFPDRVLIDVRERQPLATFVGSDTRYRVIDRDGFVLDVLDGRPSDYMLVDGIGPDLEAGSAAGGQYGAAAQLVGALPDQIRGITIAATLDPTTGDLGLIVQRIPVVDPEDAADPVATELTEPELVEVRIGSFNGLDGKLARLLQLVNDGLDDTGKIDVSTDDVIG